MQSLCQIVFPYKSGCAGVKEKKAANENRESGKLEVRLLFDKPIQDDIEPFSWVYNLE